MRGAATRCRVVDDADLALTEARHAAHERALGDRRRLVVVVSKRFPK
jgi:hypothetical protein